MATVVSLMVADPSPDVVIESVPTYVDAGRGRKLWAGVKGMTTASWRLARGRADVLHVHLAHGGSIVRKSVPMAVARRAGIPVVVHAHSYDFAGWFDRIPSVAQASVIRALAADRWLVLGSGLAEGYADRLRIAAADITVLYNPVRLPDSVVAQTDAHPVRVVTLGRLGQRKGSFDLVQAVARLAPEVRSRLAVTMRGDGDVEEVRAAVRDAGVDDVVTVGGWAGPEECVELLSGAHVFALPSYSEGLPMALLEAMSHGLAPVCTAVGSIGEAVTDGRDGIVIDAGDVGGLAEALTSLVDDEQLRRRIADGARRTVSDFDVTSWYTELHGIWRALLDARHLGQ